MGCGSSVPADGAGPAPRPMKGTEGVGTQSQGKAKDGVGDDGTVYVGSYDNKLYAVAPVCGGCAATELRLCGPARTDPWTCLTCMTAHEAPLRLAGCGIANASDFCSHSSK